jgi:hypothetical protein
MARPVRQFGQVIDRTAWTACTPFALFGSYGRRPRGVVMPVSYSIDTERKLVVTRITGAPTADEIFDHNERLSSDPEFSPDFRQLVDMTGLTEIRVGSGVIKDTSRDHFFSPGARRAFVAPSDCAFGLARMFATHSEAAGQTIEVFRELDGAEEWLDQ